MISQSYDDLSEQLPHLDISSLTNGSYHVYLSTKDGLRTAKKLIVVKTY